MSAGSPAALRTQHSGLSSQHSRRSGPRTPEGKAAVSQNAVTHGLRSERPVLSSESEKVWEAHLAGTLAHFRPRDAYERALTERVALSLWRLCRVTRFETASLSRAIDRAEDDARERLAQRHRGRPAPHPDEASRALREETEHLRRVRATPSGDGTDHVVRYEGHLNRQLTSALRALDASQARPLPQPAAGAPHAPRETAEQSPTSDGFDTSGTSSTSASSPDPTADSQTTEQSPSSDSSDGSDGSDGSPSSPHRTSRAKTTEQSPAPSESERPHDPNWRFYLNHRDEIDARAAGRYVAIGNGQLYGFHHTLRQAQDALAGRWDRLILLDGHQAA